MHIEDLGKAFLAHYGVKGMKWGVRRKRKASKESDDFAETKNLRGRKVSELSTSELRRLNDRLNLEQNYNRMNPSRSSRGRRFVTTTLATGATINTAISFARSPAGQAIKGMLSPQVGRLTDFSSAIDQIGRTG